MRRTLASRRAGVLMHITSLPGPHAAGTLGADAMRFVDFLGASGCSVWQTLPLGPVDAHGSPYCLRSAHAGYSQLIDEPSLRDCLELPAGMAFAAVRSDPLQAYRSFTAAANPSQLSRFASFVRQHRRWLLPYGLFELCSLHFDAAPWWLWPAAFSHRDRASLFALWCRQKEYFRGILLQQYLFDLQWFGLKRYANERGIYLFGDLPFYMDLNSADVWWRRGEYLLDADGRPQAVAGVPPDYFNADGQLWGNPLYDWDAMAGNDFAWWKARLQVQLARFDLLRIDHFRALESYWAVPADATTAREGQWRPGHGAALLESLARSYGELPLVAEDLGIITDSVRALRDRFALPGMAVLQFAFDGSPDNPHLPENCSVNTVIYTGTHDNDTSTSWYAGLDAAARTTVARMLHTDVQQLPDTLIDAVFASRAQLAVVPMQDLLGLGSAARMNTPGSVVGNWRWRLDWAELGADVPPRTLARARRFARTV